MPTSIDPVLSKITNQLLEMPGVRAVWLAGSQARRDAHDLSDIDVGVIAVPGTPFRVDISRVEGRLVTVTWTTADDTRSSFHSPGLCGTAVPGWRDARLLHDPHGEGAELVRQATEWTWEGRGSACDAWVVARVTEYAEAALKLIAARRAGDDVAAAAQRSFLALRLPIVVSVHLRLLYPNWRTLWRLVGEALEEEWGAAHRTALAVDASGAAADRAALALFVQTVEQVRVLMGPAEREVVDPISALARGEQIRDG